MTVNKCIFIGNLGRDPEFRATPDGLSVANIAIAVTEKYKDKQGQQKEITEWVNIVFFGRLAEVAAQYMAKGMQIYVEGRMKTEKYEKDGITRYSTKIVGEKMQMLSRKNEKQNNSEQRTQESESEMPPEFDDDIPF
jgi:single-strand DNA-binding protein